ncbi:MAG: class I SAM-dependent methyltransferase [Chloroflexi bacterium]|nr:class I SAM-dependent methyltransferase [Chloroflexota bacterium]
MGPVILVLLGISVLVAMFIVMTDGRYGGKRLMYWVYDRFGSSMFGAHSEADRWRNLAQTLELRGNESILDVGTAVGDLPLTLAGLPNFSGRVIGIDWSPRMVATAQAEAGRRGLSDRVKFKVVDVRKTLPYDRNEFDVVCCLGLLETWPKPEQILDELVRVLKPGGVMVLSVYQGWAAANVALSFDWYQQHLAALGLEDVRLAPCRQNQDVVIARSPFIETSE